MDQSIKQVFEDECAHLEIGPKLVKRLATYQMNFVNKNEDHIAFFGGHLLGVSVVRFMPADHDRWFDEILEVDPTNLQERLLALPSVNAEARGLASAHVASDVLNLSCAWLTHALYQSQLLTPEQKHEAMINAVLVLQYKFLTSRLYRHFPYPADPAIAEATYAQLSYKFSIKQYGNWSALLRARAEEVISRSGIHFNAVSKMNNDAEVVYLLNDTQGRIRDMVKNIYGVHKQVKDQGIRIFTTSATVEHDGVEILKDKSKNLLAYGRYINAVITDKSSFIREELVVVIEKLMHTMPPKLFRQSLEWMSNNYRLSGAKEIEEVVNEALIHSFDYLTENRSLIKNDRDLPGLLSRLRGVYMSSRSTDPALFQLREKTESIVKKATGNKNESVVASVRTGILLYVVIRAYTMRHYTSSGA